MLGGQGEIEIKRGGEYMGRKREKENYREERAGEVGMGSICQWGK